MRILNISNNYHNSSLWQNMHETYEKLHHGEACFVAFSRKGVTFEKNQLEVYDFPILDAADRLFFFRKINKCFNALNARRDIIDDVNCIHAHTLFSDGAVAYKMWKAHSIPYIVSIRNTDINTFYRLKPYLKPYADRILYNASSIICLSPSYNEQILSKVSSKIRSEVEKKTVIVPNGINKYWFDNTCGKRTCSKDGTIRLVTAGQVSKNKNQATIAKACELLISRGCKVEYHLAGKIEDTGYFALFKDKPFVKYHGALCKEDLCVLYRQCDIFVLASRYETFGLVYAEAMTQGLPIIYTQGQGFDGQFPNGEVGFAVPCDDVQSIVVKVLDAIERYDELSANAITGCRKFEAENVVETFYCLLCSAVGGIEDK